MAGSVLEEKLESLRSCVQRLEEKRPARIEQLERDQDLQDILALNLTRAVQLSVDIAAHLVADSELPPPETMAESFNRLRELGIIDDHLSERLSGAVGFRNIAVHQYESVDWAIVFEIVHSHLEDFRELARAVVSHSSDS